MKTRMSESIDITSRYEEKDIVSASRAFYAQAYQTRFHLILSALGAASGLFLVLVSDVFFLGYTFLLLCGGYFYINYLTYFSAARNQFQRNQKAYRRQITMRFFEDKVISFSEVGKSENSWEFYEKVWETRDAYFLFYGETLFTTIPKRVFSSFADEIEFRNLIARQINPVMRIGKFSVAESEENREYLPPTSPPDWR